ncbi:SseB family protein [Sulfitobacter sp. LCG007]
MTETTPLDRAFAAMREAPQDNAAELGFYERLADCELFLLLATDARDGHGTITPDIFDLGTEKYVLVFDREERLSEFTGRPAPYAALSGRVIAQMLAGQGIGLGLNLDVAPSSQLLPPAAVDWLHEMLANPPVETEARFSKVLPPAGLPERLLHALDAKLSSAAGRAECAWLAAVAQDDAKRGYLLAFIDAAPGAQGALARAVSEALTFSGLADVALDVTFAAPGDPLVERLARVGLRFDLPQPEPKALAVRPAPGSDPSRPPILK